MMDSPSFCVKKTAAGKAAVTGSGKCLISDVEKVKVRISV